MNKNKGPGSGHGHGFRVKRHSIRNTPVTALAPPPWQNFVSTPYVNISCFSTVLIHTCLFFNGIANYFLPCLRRVNTMQKYYKVYTHQMINQLVHGHLREITTKNLQFYNFFLYICSFCVA